MVCIYDQYLIAGSGSSRDSKKFPSKFSKTFIDLCLSCLFKIFLRISTGIMSASCAVVDAFANYIVELCSDSVRVARNPERPR